MVQEGFYEWLLRYIQNKASCNEDQSGKSLGNLALLDEKDLDED